MFGIKRPLRFLIRKLELDEAQIMEVADAINDFRIERDQAEVDRRRARKLLSEAMRAEDFDLELARQATEQQEAATRALQESFNAALQRVHVCLNEEQRLTMAFLLNNLEMDF